MPKTGKNLCVWQPAAHAANGLLLNRGQRVRADETIETLGEGAMRIGEERPIEPIALGTLGGRAHQSPSKTGLRLAAKAS